MVTVDEEVQAKEFLKRAARKAAKKAQEEVIELSSMPQSPTISYQRPDSTRSQALTPSPTPLPSNFRDRGCFGFPREDN